MVLKKWWVDFTCRYIYIIACIINRIMSGIEKNYYFLINLFLAKPVPLPFFQKNPVINRGSRLRADHSINITIRTHGSFDFGVILINPVKNFILFSSFLFKINSF